MTNPKSGSSTQDNFGEIPEKWRERFLLKRIDEEDIELSLEERNAIILMLNQGLRFAQIGKYTIMLNTIKSIDPKWGPNNIPPRPRALIRRKYDELPDGRTKLTEYAENQDELNEWDKCFKTPLLVSNNIL